MINYITKNSKVIYLLYFKNLLIYQVKLPSLVFKGTHAQDCNTANLSTG